MRYTLKEVYELFKNSGYIYKGKTVTLRTIVTMADNGLFETLEYCECGKCRMVDLEEVRDMSRQNRKK